MTAIILTKLIPAIIVALVIGVIAYAALKHFLVPDSDDYTRNALRRLSEDSGLTSQKDFSPVNILKDDVNISSPVGRALLTVPGMRSTYEMLLKSGQSKQIPAYAGMCILFAIVVAFCVFKFVNLNLAPAVHIAMSVLVGLFAGFFIPRKFFLKNAIQGRNDKFINQFPDALDMIVRSVKSGYPLNSALKMLAENTDAPVSTEFKQVADEIAYGRSLNEALSRMAERVDEPDIHFFVVVLAVQQETGGNLAEVITNLSGIIRKRKQLKLKIKAMTSEGRATGYILGSLPFVIFLILSFSSPKHLEPLFNTPEGGIVLGIAIGLVLTAWAIVKRMINFEI